MIPVAAMLLASQHLVRLGTKTPVLTFHDVIPHRTQKSLWFDCSVSEFTSILNRLAERRARFVSVEDLYLHLTKGTPLPPRAVAITFADNYLGFYRYALPILRARKIPTIMFVHTGFVGSQVGRPKMSWAQLIELDREGLVTLASQTVTHPEDLRTLSRVTQLKEMADSKASLQKHLGHPIRFLAYPNGRFNADSLQAAKQAGYAMAFSEEQAPAELSSSLFAVNRYVHTKWDRAWKDAYGK